MTAGDILAQQPVEGNAINTGKLSQKPGDPAERPGFVIDFDGMTEISKYEYERKLKIRRNEERLESLGLMDLKMKQRRHGKEGKEKRDSINRKSMQAKHEPAERRRSARAQKKPPELNVLDIDKVEKKMKTVKTIRRRVGRSKTNVRSLSEKERGQLADIPSEDWVDDMEYFMERILNNSKQNIRQTMGKVQLLACGAGIRHPRSTKKGNVFKNQISVTLGDDIAQMHADASNWVDEHGGDTGNGWLVQHPVMKIWVYQNARYERGYPFKKPDND